jgi:hypothetical protein
MTVKQLIQQLQKYKNKDMQVFYKTDPIYSIKLDRLRVEQINKVVKVIIIS